MEFLVRLVTVAVLVVLPAGGTLWATESLGPTASRSPNTVPVPAWDLSTPPKLGTNFSTKSKSIEAPDKTAEAERDLGRSAKRGTPSGLNSALANDREGVATGNLGTVEDATFANTRKQDELDLAAARRQRMDHNGKDAEKILVRLLESEGTEELKRTALLELALVAQQEDELTKANHIFAQFLHLYPRDASVPEVLLRQGLLFRKMGASALALSKFYAVMTSAMNLNMDSLSYYQRLTLQAKIEIAETFFETGRYEEAVEKYSNLLKEESPDLNRTPIHAKLIRALSTLQRPADVVAQANLFIANNPRAADVPEVRFLLANALKSLGRNRESRQQVLLLLQSKSAAAEQNPADWAYWQQRTGNEIANQLYQEGDYMNALDIYLGLAEIDQSMQWQLPVYYQTGLTYERLNQAQKAVGIYDLILQKGKALGTNGPPSLRAVLDMAKWRKNFVGWQENAEQKNQELKISLPASAAPVATR